MKLTADIAGEKHDLQIRREGERVFAEIDGRSFEMDVRDTPEGGYLLNLEGRVYDCRVGKAPAQPERTEVRVRNQVYEIAVIDPKRLRATAGAALSADGSAQIVAQMPGKVVRVMVEAGSVVEAGDPVVVVEAMKMQNEMKSPKAGTVTTLNAREGETVNAGEVLAVIE
jgi:biotin carboxyl carrier protein